MDEDKKYPLKYTSEPVEKYSTDKMTCQLVRLQLNDRGRAMYGYLFIPKGEANILPCWLLREPE